MKKIFLYGFAFIALIIASCGDKKPDEKTTATKQAPAEVNNEDKTRCGPMVEFPQGCDTCSTDEICEIKTEQAHWIPYATFKNAISHYFHKPSSKLGLNDVYRMLLSTNCETQIIVLGGNHEDSTSNEDIKIYTSNTLHKEAIYQILFFKGLIRLDPKQIYFYKGDTHRGSNSCKDILIEVVYSDSTSYYDLSDSEDTIEGN